MGYSTSFEGVFTVCDVRNKPKKLDKDVAELLNGIAGSRRMARDVSLIGLNRECYGTEGEFYYPKKGGIQESEDPSIVNQNRPPLTQPGLYCQWVYDEETGTIAWDGVEKFYNYTEWIDYILKKILIPRGYYLRGDVSWEGEGDGDAGVIHVVPGEEVVAQKKRHFR